MVCAPLILSLPKDEPFARGSTSSPRSDGEDLDSVLQRGFVVGLRFAAVRAARFFAVAAVRFFFADFFFAVGVALVPDDTRDECLARWRTTFFGAASAAALSAKDASSASTNIFIV